MTVPMLQLEGVVKVLGQTRAVDGLSLSIEPGQLFGLLGPNGAGKTTLIRMLMGLQRPTAGSICLFGEHAPGSAEVRPRIGYMPQQLAVYRGLSVRENLLFFGRIYRLPEEELQLRVDEVMAMVELDAWSEQPVATLSGGMVRRVMLASALVHRPQLLLLDEPTAGVDPLLRIKFWHWFEEMVAAGTTIIVTTHTIAEASRCHQALFLRNGRILEQGTPAELKRKYASEDLEQAFVAAIHRQGEQ